MFWTRRKTLGAIGVLGTLPAIPILGATRDAFPDDALHGYARAVGAAPAVAAIGREAAAGRDAHELEAALRARVPGARDEAGWRAGLLAAGREDLARDGFVVIRERQLMLVEADFLGLAALLQPVA